MITHLANTLLAESKLEFARTCIKVISERTNRPVVSSKFGPDASVFLHLITTQIPDIPVIWVDSGFNSPDTLNYVKLLQTRLSLNLKVYRPLQPPDGIDSAVQTKQIDELVSRVKIEPIKEAFKDHNPDVWFSSLRRYQTRHRATRSFYEQATPTMIKAYPMLDWSQEVVAQYREDNGLPGGPLAIAQPKSVNIPSAACICISGRPLPWVPIATRDKLNR